MTSEAGELSRLRQLGVGETLLSEASRLVQQARSQGHSATLGQALVHLGAISAEQLSALSAGPYELGEELGRGGMGAVRLARDRRLERTVAMKTLLATQDEEAQLRFVNEARITGQLEHPNIPPVHELGEQQGRPYFTMKRVRGESLQELLRGLREGRRELSLTRRLEVLLKILDAVGFAHAHGVLHRDLKPANIMLGEHGEVLVMDWGLAKVQGEPSQGTRVDSVVAPLVEGLTQQGQAAGTPGYMGPEQASGAELDERADIFALGCILYELLTTERAWPGSAVEVMARMTRGQAPTFPRELRLPPELVAITQKAMALEIEERYADVGRLRADLEAFLEGRAVSVRQDPWLTRLRRAIRRRPALSATLAVALLAAAGFAGLLLRPASLTLTIEPPADAELLGQPLILRLGAEVVGELSWEARSEAGWAPRTVEATVWPARPQVLQVEHPGLRLVNGDAEGRLLLAFSAGEARELKLALEARRERVTLVGPDGKGVPTDWRVTLVPKSGGEGETFVGKEALRVPAGDYEVFAARSGGFPMRAELKVTPEAAASLELRAENLERWRLDLIDGVLDVALGDADGDGPPELFLRSVEGLTCIDLRRGTVRWKEPEELIANAHSSPGMRLSVGDLGGFGSLVVAAPAPEGTSLRDGRSGASLRRLTLGDARPLVLPGRLLLATSYRGLLGFDALGQRDWSCRIPKYAIWGRLLPFDDRAGRPCVIVGSASPNTIAGVRVEDGALLWRHIGGSSEVAVALIPSAGAAPRVAFCQSDSLTLIDAWTGAATAPAKLTLEGVRRLSWAEEGALLIAEGRGAIAAYELGEGGQITERWRDDGPQAGPGALLDVDGDGEREWLQPRLVAPELKGLSEVALELRGLDGGLKTFPGFNPLSSPTGTRPRLDAGAQPKVPPALVSVYGDGRRQLLLVGATQVRLLELSPASRFSTRGRGAMAIRQLPGEQRAALFELHGGDLICWRVEGRDLRERWRTPVTERGDRLNIDELRVLPFASGPALLLPVHGFGDYGFLIIRPQGAEVRCEYVEVSAPAEPGFRAPVVARVGADELAVFIRTKTTIHELRLRPGASGIEARPARPSPWALSLGAAQLSVSSDPTPRLIVAAFENNRTRLQSHALTDRNAEPKMIAVLPQRIGRAPPLVEGDRAWAIGDQGTAFVVSGEQARAQLALSSPADQLFWRQRAGGRELIAVGQEGELAALAEGGEDRIFHHSSRSLNAPGTWRARAVDLDGDGDEELLIVTSQGEVLALRGEGELCLRLSRAVGLEVSRGDSLEPPELGDLDGDGRVEVIAHGDGQQLLWGVSAFLSPQPPVGRVALSALFGELARGAAPLSETRRGDLRKQLAPALFELEPAWQAWREGRDLNEVERLKGRLREVFAGAEDIPEQLERWLRVVEGQGRAAEIERGWWLAGLLFPEHPRLKPLVVSGILRRLRALESVFDRLRPQLLLEQATALWDAPELVVAHCRFEGQVAADAVAVLKSIARRLDPLIASRPEEPWLRHARAGCLLRVALRGGFNEAQWSQLRPRVVADLEDAEATAGGRALRDIVAILSGAKPERAQQLAENLEARPPLLALLGLEDPAWQLHFQLSLSDASLSVDALRLRWRALRARILPSPATPREYSFLEAMARRGLLGEALAFVEELVYASAGQISAEKARQISQRLEAAARGG